jgi:hypothetical protein
VFQIVILSCRPFVVLATSSEGLVECFQIVVFFPVGLSSFLRQLVRVLLGASNSCVLSSRYFVGLTTSSAVLIECFK